MVKRSLILFCSLIFLIMSFVLAAHVITTSDGGNSYSVNESVVAVYNVTVNNTDALVTANITQVNITFLTNFSFIVDSNGTDAGTHTFTNNSTVLSWDNDGLVMNLTWKYFWFNATVSTPGTYNLTITTTNITGSTYITNLSVTVNDTTSPTASFGVNPVSFYNSSNASVVFDLKCADNYNSSVLELWGNWSGSGWQMNKTNSTSINDTYWNITVSGISDGGYVWGVYCNDSAGNTNWTTNRTLTVDGTNPVITLISPANAISADTDAYNFTFNVTDDQTIANCSLIFDGSIINTSTSINNSGGTNGIYNSSFLAATHNWSINCTDVSGNVGNSSNRTLTVTFSVATSNATGGSGGGVTGWLNTRLLTAEQFEQGAYYEYKKSYRARVVIGGETHHVGVVELTSTTVKINVSSETQQATLSVGDERRFDVTGDNYYDVLVTLNNIDAISQKANMSMMKIYEEITEETIAEETEKEGDLKEVIEGELMWLWILIGVIIVVVVVVVILKKKK